MVLIGRFTEIALYLALVALVVFWLAYAVRPAQGVGRHVKETFLAFIAFYFLILGLRMMAPRTGPDEVVLLGDLFASLGLTFFWAARRRTPDR
ncbi:MAG: hypothetical protein ABR874_21470 [Candidatus Sulfotelmatobacter sp.]|jgi:ethanolamine transporter EutH